MKTRGFRFNACTSVSKLPRLRCLPLNRFNQRLQILILQDFTAGNRLARAPPPPRSTRTHPSPLARQTTLIYTVRNVDSDRFISGRDRKKKGHNSRNMWCKLWARQMLWPSKVDNEFKFIAPEWTRGLHSERRSSSENNFKFCRGPEKKKRLAPERGARNRRPPQRPRLSPLIDPD